LHIEDLLRKNGYEVSLMDARGVATEAGSARASNVVILGVLSRFLDISEENWKRAIVRALPEKLHDFNLRAFHMGCTALVRPV
jgi:indolepyruvate ferredoxin oxidoreductase beta subunit